MIADKCERYEISNVPEGLQITMWQALPSLGFGVVALVILAACFVTDPYPGHGRIWAGLGVVALAVVALFGVRVESWIISDRVVRYKRSRWKNEVSFERSIESPLILRVELVPNDPEGTEPPFLHVVHAVGADGIELGDGFRFRTTTNLDRFLETLRNVTRLEVSKS